MTVDLELLFKLRLVVARVGEMDLARWWNTEGQLGAMGASVIQRGFRRTYRFAQARSVFAVAAHRCQSAYDRPNTVTLWKLPPTLEDEFELRWRDWMLAAADWEPFFTQLQVCTPDLEAELLRFRLVEDMDVEQGRRIRRSAEGVAAELKGDFEGSGSDLRHLALGFARGDAGAVCVPFQAADSGSAP